ncbi:SH3 domain-containing protein [Phycomyces blakesleeanus]|uniref:SH3 domain-containing protein n=1 Tax=Phycomyces blakesleeanus TaxID=4837 RepID=A0ABR3ALI6_PHYBL
MALEIVYAIHDFEAENEDEITFLMGDPIVVIEKDEKYMDGWWQGRNIHGHVGLFPMNYTSIDHQPENNRTSQSSNYTSSPEPERYMGSYSLEDEIDHAISQIPPRIQ